MQDFESWPLTANIFGTYSNDQWLISDGIVETPPGGYGQTIGARSAWLNDFEATSNAWIRAPFMSHGINAVAFMARRGDGNIGDQFFEVERSSDGTNWVPVQTFDRINENWSSYTAQIDIFDPQYVRIKKTGDFGDEQYIGLDNITVTPSPGVRLSGLANAPASPSIFDPVHITISAQPGLDTSNVVLQAFYRPGTSGVFTAIGMTNTAGFSYQTTSPIPPGHSGNVQYYVQCTYDGFGQSPIYAPGGGSNNPAIFDTTKPYLNTTMRQLTPSSHTTAIIISEIMYNPRARADTNSLAFIELFNTAPVDQDIGGWQIAGDADFTFPLGTVFPARSHVVVARDPASVTNTYGLPSAWGPLAGSLPNGGGTLRLRNREGALLLEVTYSDDMPWPVAADGAGHSLVLSRPDYGEGLPEAWSASRFIDGSPGYADPVTNSPLDNVVFNEILAHTDLPDVDYIELYNAGTQSVDISGCTLSDSPDTNKFTIPPGTLLGPRGFRVFYQTNLTFSLSSHGDDVYFGAPDGSRVIAAMRFPAQINGVSIGRWPDGAPEFAALAAKTPGASNTPSGLRQENVIMNELMYHPLSGLDDDEYIELFNQSTGAVNIGYWRFTDGVTFAFPPGTTIPGRGYLVVARNATNLIARYPQLGPGNTIGNYSGQLADGGEHLRLSRPDDLALPDMDFVVVDEITYRDGDDWGRWSDGGGSSLELVDPRADNRQAMNWAGSDETQKAGWTTVNVTAPMDNGAGPPDELRVCLLQASECLLDNVRVLQPNGTTVYLNADFEAGLGSWRPDGNHIRSSLDITEGYGTGKSLHLRSSGPGMEGTWNDGNWGEAFWNRVSVPLAATPPTGTNVTIQAKVRWLAGWPNLVLALRGYWMEAAVYLNPPNNLGTPAQANSRLRTNNGPAISEVSHLPVLPASNQNAVVSCRVSDPDGIAAVTLRYRLDPATNLTAVAMNDTGTGGDALAGDGCYSGSIPAQPIGTLAAFTITAIDAHASPQTNSFPLPAPPGAPPREALVRFGQQLPPGILGAYAMWITQTNVWYWQNLSPLIDGTNNSRYSNEPVDITFVSGGDHLFYNATARFRGLWRSYGSPEDSGAYAIDLPGSESFLGDAELVIDQPGQTGGDAQRQKENYCYWAAGRVGLPTPQIRFVRLFVNGYDRGVQHDLQTPGNAFTTSWYGDPDPAVYKMYGWEGDPFERVTDADGNLKQSIYRWHLRLLKRAHPSDDFTPVYDVANASTVTSNALYEARLNALLDLRNWVGYFALNGALANWDSYGWKVGHNAYIHLPHDRGGSIFIYDLDYSMEQPQGVYPSTKFPHPDRLITYPRYRRIYLALLKELANGPMTAPEAAGLMDPLYLAFLNSATFGISPPIAAKTWVAGYRPTLLSTVAANDAPFAITSNGGANFSTTNPIVTLNGTAPIDMDSLRINGRPNRLTYPTVTNWTLRVGLAQGANALLLSAHNWRGDLVASNTITVTLTQPPPEPTDQIIFSEIMYNPLRSGDEYLEVYNRSTNQTFDLGGWRINGADFTFDGGSILGPRQFAVIAQNAAAYQHTYGNAEVLLGTYAGNLDDGGETITLQKPLGTNAWTSLNQVTYDDTLPWSPEADGHGQALQVLDLSRDNARPGNWGVISTAVTNGWKFRSITGTVTNGSPITLGQARLNIYLPAAGRLLIDRLSLVTGTVAEAGANLISNGTFETPLSPYWSALGNHSNSVIATTNAQSGNGCLQIVAMGPGSVPSHTITQSRSLAALPNRVLTLSYWYFEDSVVDGLTVELTHSSLLSSHGTAPVPPATPPIATPGRTNTVTAVLPPLPTLWINEVMPSNVTAWADNLGEFEPWIEIFNSGTASVDLSSCRLSNSYATPGLWAFPAGLTLAPQARLLVWADAETNQTAGGNVHASFTLNSLTGSVVLALAYSNQFIVLDALNYDNVGADFSYGSYPEGDPQARQIFHNPTPGFTNTPTSFSTRVVINEWMADNATTVSDPTDHKFDDWFELYNPSVQPVNIGGYFLTDNLSKTNQFVIPGGHIIPAGGYLLVWADSADKTNGPGIELHTNFGLSKSGEAIALFRPDGTLLDAVTFGPQATDHSEGSWPDGDPAAFPMTPPTPRAQNRVLLVSSVNGAGSGPVTLNWSAQSGSVYRVFGTTNLIATNWLSLGTVTASGSTVSFIDTNAVVMPKRFYRLNGID